MAKAVNKTVPPRHWSRLLLWVGGTVLVLVLLTALWHRQHRPEQIIASLPARPESLGRLPVLTGLIDKTVGRIRSRKEMLAGLEELASIYHANGCAAEATACWRLLVQEQPRNGRWCYRLADAQRRQSDYAAMAASLERVTVEDPTYAPAWLKLAEYEFKTGQLERAAAHYRRHSNLQKDEPLSRLGLARVARQQGDASGARREIEALVRRFPRFAPAQNLYAEILAAAGETTLARRHRWLGREAGRYREPDDPWLDELETWCRDPHLLQLAAAVRIQTGRSDEGLRLLEQAVRLAPTEASLRAALGKLHLERGNPAQARAELIAGLGGPGQNRPTIAYFVYLNQACRSLGRADEALQFVRQGLTLHPTAHELVNALGQTWESLGQAEAALSAYREAVALNPEDAECNFNLATLLIPQERFAEARACLLRSLTRQPTFPKSLKLLAKLELVEERAEPAAEFLIPLYEAQCGDPQVRELMVEWHLLAGRRQEARQVLQEGLELARLLGNQAEISRCEEALRALL